MNGYDINDVDNGLADIRGMTILAIRTMEGVGKAVRARDPEADESLSFSLHDILARVEKLREGLGDDRPKVAPKVAAEAATHEQPAIAASDAGSDCAESGARTSETVSAKAYFEMDGFLCNVVHMIQLADDMALEMEVPEDRETWDRFAFAIHHSRLMVEAFRRCYDKRDFGNEAAVVGV
jgi:hypothetical protein